MDFADLRKRIETAFEFDERHMFSEGALRRVVLELLRQYGEQLQPPEALQAGCAEEAKHS